MDGGEIALRGPWSIFPFGFRRNQSTVKRVSFNNDYGYGVTRDRKRMIKKKIYFLYDRNIRIYEVTYKKNK